MGIRELINKLKGFGGIREPEELAEGQTRDPHLRSLRRHRQKQLDELEKESLKREIGIYEKEKVREFIGIKKEVLRKKIKQRQEEGFLDGKGFFKGNL